MAITASGLFVATFLSVFNASQEPINLVSDSVKVALFTNSVTPNFSTNTSYAAAPYTSNQVTGTGYSAGGVALATKTFTETPTGNITFDADDSSWGGATFSSVRGALIWDDTPTSPTADPALCLVNFGSDYSVSSGTFTIQWAATGIFTIDITP
jgi:hypothetical protein